MLEKYKTVTATIKTCVKDEPPAEEWGIDLIMNDEYVIFVQGSRTVSYRKQSIREMTIHVKWRNESD